LSLTVGAARASLHGPCYVLVAGHGLWPRVPALAEEDFRLVTRPALEHFAIFIFVVGAVAVVFAGLFLVRLLSPREPHPEKGMPYECGEDPVGSARIRYNIRFFLVALIFLVFDVEIALTIPVAVVFRETLGTAAGVFALIEIAIFLAILFFALVYVWVRGDLDWIRGVRRPRKVGPERPGGIRQ